MDFSIYGDDSKALIRFDPRTKLFIFLACGVTSLYTYSGLYILLFAGAVCAVLALSGKPWTALKAFLLFAVALYIKEAVDHTGGSSAVVVLVVSVLTTLILYSLPTIMSILLIVQTTRISQFLSALTAMHLPVKAVIPIAVLFRFIPTVQDEWTGIRKAMAFRGISLDIISVIKHPFKTIEYVLKDNITIV